MHVHVFSRLSECVVRGTVDTSRAVNAHYRVVFDDGHAEWINVLALARHGANVWRRATPETTPRSRAVAKGRNRDEEREEDRGDSQDALATATAATTDTDVSAGTIREVQYRALLGLSPHLTTDTAYGQEEELQVLAAVFGVAVVTLPSQETGGGKGCKHGVARVFTPPPPATFDTSPIAATTRDLGYILKDDLCETFVDAVRRNMRGRVVTLMQTIDHGEDHFQTVLPAETGVSLEKITGIARNRMFNLYDVDTFRVEEIPGDGDCAYNAFLRGFDSLGGEYPTRGELGDRGKLLTREDFDDVGRTSALHPQLGRNVYRRYQKYSRDNCVEVLAGAAAPTLSQAEILRVLVAHNARSAETAAASR